MIVKSVFCCIAKILSNAVYCTICKLQSTVCVVAVKSLFVIARSEIQMGTGNKFLNFNLIKKFAKFVVV